MDVSLKLETVFFFFLILFYDCVIHSSRQVKHQVRTYILIYAVNVFLFSLWKANSYYTAY